MIRGRISTNEQTKGSMLTINLLSNLHYEPIKHILEIMIPNWNRIIAFTNQLSKIMKNIVYEVYNKNN